MYVISSSRVLSLLKTGMVVCLLSCPVIALAAGSYNQCIQQNENRGGNPATMNQYGYVGLYQFGVMAAMDGGICSNRGYVRKFNSAGAEIQDWSQCDFKGPVAQQYGINNLNDFRNSPNAANAQNAAQDKFTGGVVDGYVDKYYGRIGETINGVVITKDTLRSLYHLKGGKAVDEFMAGGNPADRNGTTMSEYAKCLQDCINGTGTGECSFGNGSSNPAAFCV